MLLSHLVTFATLGVLFVVAEDAPGAEVGEMYAELLAYIREDPRSVEVVLEVLAQLVRTTFQVVDVADAWKGKCSL